MNQGNFPNMSGQPMPVQMGPQPTAPPSSNSSFQHHILRTLSQQPTPQGWQTTVETQVRVNIIHQIFSQLRLLQSQFDLQHQLNLAMGFESKAFTESRDRNTYEQQCKNKLADIHQVRTKQSATVRQQMNMQRNVPQHLQHMGQPMTQNQAQGHVQFPQGRPNPQQQQMMQFQGMPMQQQAQQPGRQQQVVPVGARPSAMPQGQQSAAHQMPQSQSQQPSFNPTAEENQQINRIAQQLYNQTPPDRLEELQKNLRHVSAEQRENLRRHGVEPMIVYFRSQATREFCKMKRSQASAQGGAAPQPGAGPRLPQNMARPVGQQAPGPQQQPFQTPFDQIIGQQQDGLRSQEAGQDVVPASNPQANLDQRNAARINAQQQLNMQNGGNHPMPNAPANHPQTAPFWNPQPGQRNLNPGVGINGHTSAAGFSNVTQAPANVLQGQPGGLDNQITRTPSQTPGMPNLNKAAAPPGQTPNMWPQRTPQMGQARPQGGPMGQQAVQQPTERSEAPQQRPPLLQNLHPRMRQHLANLPEEGRRAFLMDFQRRQVAQQHQMQQQQLQQQQQQQQQQPQHQTAQQAPKAASSMATMNQSFPMSSQPSQPGVQTGPIATMSGQNMAVSQPTMPNGKDVQSAFAPPNSAFGGPARQQPGPGQQPAHQRGTPQHPGSNANSAPPLTKEQARQMDQNKYPVNLGRQLEAPPEVQTWGQLKDWATQNAPTLPPNASQKLETMQAILYRNQQREARQPHPGSLPAGAAQPQAPFAQMVSHPNVQAPVSAPRPPNAKNNPQFTPQDIQATRASLPPQFQNVPEDQIRTFMMRTLLGKNPQQTQNSQLVSGSATPRGPSDPPQPSQTNQPKPPGQQSQKGAGPASKQGQGTRIAPVVKPPQKGIKRNNNDDEDVVEVPKPNPSNSQAGAQGQSSAPGTKQRSQAPEPKALANAKNPVNQNMPGQSPDVGFHNAGPSGPLSISREEVGRRDARLRQLGNELSLNQPQRRPVPMTTDTRAQMSQKFKELSPMVSRLDGSLPAFFRHNPNESVTRRLLDMRNKIKAQYRDKNFNLVDQFTITPQELDEASTYIKEYFIHIMSKFSKRNTNGPQPGEQQQNQQHSQKPPTSQEKAPLSAANLKEQQNMLQAERQATMQKHASGHGSRVPAAPTSDKHPFPLGSQSPHGTPTAYGPQKVYVDQLVLPNKRRKSNHPPSAGSTPVPAQEASVSKSSPLAPKLASPEVQRAAVPQMSFKCGVSDCVAGQRGFASQAELEQHNSHEHERKEADIEDPVEFCLQAVREALGLDERGQSMPRKETLEAPKMKTSLSAQSDKVVRQEASTPMARASTQTGPSPGSNLLKTPQTMSAVRTPASDARFAVQEGKGKKGKGPASQPRETSPPPIDPWAGSYISADAITTAWSSLADMQSLSFTKIQMGLTPSSTLSSGNDKSEKNSPRPSDISENDVVKISLGVGNDEKDGWIPGDWFEDSLYGDIESMHFGPDQMIGDVDWDVFGDISDTEMADAGKGKKKMEDVISEEWLKVYAPERLAPKKGR